jgi:hypothetical protein
MLNCTRCENTGFLNISQVDDATLRAFDNTGDHLIILEWIASHEEHDVQVCDCCGNGENWHNVPGEHDERDFGRSGPYAYNGGLPECY